jgi:glycosyltransferase involved in cell wall biosynthesis
MSAYLCAPGKGSELAVGWNWALQVARFHDVCVLTAEKSRKDIESELRRSNIARVHFVYVRVPCSALFWNRGRLGDELHNYLWQLAAFFHARRLHRSAAFDLIHHVTMGRYWMPSMLSLLPIPFIWGPVGGGESAPRSFWPAFSLWGKTFELGRNLARNIGERDPFVRLTARTATVALATTEQTAVRLRALGSKRVIVHPQFGMTQREMQSFACLSERTAGPFRLISIGRLIPHKGFHLGVRAFARFHEVYPDSEYWIINDGIEMSHLKALVRTHRLEGKVRLWGKLPTLTDVYEKLADCDVLVHPALHEAFGNVCLEALASGRPVLCLALGGPALQVSDETGVKVPANTPEQAVSDLASAMLRMAENPLERRDMGRASRRRVQEHFDWDAKGEFMARLYETTIHESRRVSPANGRGSAREISL